MNSYEFEDKLNAITFEYINSMKQVKASDLGLDNRAGYTLYINEDTIAVAKKSDGSLQYYGGFEYVDSEYRKEFGDWVFYSSEDDRVYKHLEKYINENV